jgi:hypothetical protein
MSIKSVALALNEFDKTVKSIRDAQLKAALERHINHMTQLLMNERILSNQARNFRLEAPSQIPIKISSYLSPKHTGS